jgi:hypothetical protein
VNVGSLFSGIGGLDHGLSRAGFRHAFFCEQDPWRRGVLGERWPGVPVYDDVRAVGGTEGLRGEVPDGPLHDSVSSYRRYEAGRGAIALLCGGFPCQDLSVAGRRAGLQAGEARPSSSSSHGSQTSLFQPEGTSSSRTFPDYFPAKADEISPSFSRRWPSSGFTTSPGECWTADTSECPSGGGVSSCLADVIQDNVASKYFLSPRAAAGILRRAEKRGRELPSHLLAALEAVARTTTTPKQDES